MQIDITSMDRADALDFAAYIFSFRNYNLLVKYCFPMMSILEGFHITKDEVQQLEKTACSFVDKKDYYIQEQISMLLSCIKIK